MCIRCEKFVYCLSQLKQQLSNSPFSAQHLATLATPNLLSCYQKIASLQEKLPHLQERFGFSNTTRVIHSAQIDLQQVDTRVRGSLASAQTEWAEEFSHSTILSAKCYDCLVFVMSHWAGSVGQCGSSETFKLYEPAMNQGDVDISCWQVSRNMYLCVFFFL